SLRDTSRWHRSRPNRKSENAMRFAGLIVLAGLVLPARLQGADGEGDAKKWLTGKWAPIPTPAPALAGATPPAEKQAGATASPKGKAKAKIKTRAKRSAAKKPAEELPKLVIEFTKDGKIRLDGDPSTLGEKFRFIKALANFPMKFAPQNKYLKISYRFTGNDAVEVTADHTWLMEKLSAGGAGDISPEKAKELAREVRPPQTLPLAAT